MWGLGTDVPVAGRYHMGPGSLGLLLHISCPALDPRHRGSPGKAPIQSPSLLLVSTEPSPREGRAGQDAVRGPLAEAGSSPHPQPRQAGWHAVICPWRAQEVTEQTSSACISHLPFQLTSIPQELGQQPRDTDRTPGPGNFSRAQSKLSPSPRASDRPSIWFKVNFILTMT